MEISVKFEVLWDSIKEYPLNQDSPALKSCIHSGNAGDIIYSLPTVKMLGVRHFIINLCTDKGFGGRNIDISTARGLAPLLLAQPYIDRVTVVSNNLPFEHINKPVNGIDFILDKFRLQEIIKHHLAISHAKAFGLNINLNEKWLFADDEAGKKDYIVLSLTPRYRAFPNEYWVEVLSGFENIIVIGLPHEFNCLTGINAEFVSYTNFLEMANIIQKSRLFIGNPSLPYAIAEGLKVKRVIEIPAEPQNAYPIGKAGYVAPPSALEARALIEYLLSDSPQTILRSQNLTLIREKSKLEALVKKEEKEIEDIKKNILDKDVHIGNLESLISQKEIKINNLQNQIINNDTQLTELTLKLQSKKSQVDELENVIFNKNIKISEFTSKFNNIESQIIDKDTKISELTVQLEQKEIEAHNFGNIIRDKDCHIGNIERALAEKEHFLNQLFSSHGWKLLTVYYKTREKILPIGSIRRGFIQKLWRLISFFLTKLRSPLKTINFNLRPINLLPLYTQSRIKQNIKLIYGRSGLKAVIEWYKGIEIINIFYMFAVPESLENGLRGRFLLRKIEMYEMQFMTATFGRINSGLELTIRNGSPSGSIIRQVKIKGENIVDNGFTSFKFEPVKNCTHIFFELKSQGFPSAGIFKDNNKTFPELTLFDALNNPAEGSINFKVIARCKTIDPYALWIMKNEPSKEELAEQKKERFPYSPKISIIVPVYNTGKDILSAMFQSVLDQTYGNWELCIADGNSDKSHVKGVLQRYANSDKRIKVKYLDKNYGIAENTNEAVSLATGEFTAFLDHDDKLAPFALYEVVKLLNSNPKLDFIYSDEDKIEAIGEKKVLKRFTPHFKPDWSPDTMRSYNYLNHFSIIRKSLVDEAGGFRKGFNGAQDYDLFFRITEKTKNIGHIPKILYHWRSHEDSTAGNPASKMYAFESGKRAIKSHLERIGYNGDGTVENGYFLGSYRAMYGIKKPYKIAVIIPNKDRADILKRCVDSIFAKTTYANYELHIIDNQSRDVDLFKYYDTLKKDPRVKISYYDKPFNYSALNNYAVSKIKDSEYIVLLNNDTEVISPDWLEAMLQLCQRENVGAVGAMLYYPNDTIQHAGVIIGIGGIAGHSHKHLSRSKHGYMGRANIIQNLSAVTAACMMVKKKVYDEVSGLDEQMEVAFNDIDFCMKVRSKGYNIIFTPFAELYHYESLSRGYEDTPEKQARFHKEIKYFYSKWNKELIKGDPYYNQNLTLAKEDFSIKI